MTWTRPLDRDNDIKKLMDSTVDLGMRTPARSVGMALDDPMMRLACRAKKSCAARPPPTR